MPATIDPFLGRVVRQLSLPNVLVDCRAIAPGDEQGLLPQERESIASSLIAVRRASGAARILGRQLLARLGQDACAIPKGLSGAPIWPAGIIGSFAHDDEIAVAAVARGGDIGSVGIDVEPAEPLPGDLLELIATPQERSMIDADPCRGRLVFVAKEAVYKAVAAFDGSVPDYHDIRLDLRGRRAFLADGRMIRLRSCVSSHLVVLAVLPKARIGLLQTAALLRAPAG